MSFKKFKEKRAQKQAENQPPLHAFVATPAYNGKVDTDYAVALADTCQWAHHYNVRISSHVMGNGAFIDLARNTFAALFLKSDATHLFYIDADLWWEPRAFFGLVQSGRPICAGAYRKREPVESYPVRMIETDEGLIKPVDGGWIECSRVATGFLCISRQVVEEMAKDCRWIKQTSEFIEDVPRLFYTDIVDDNRFLGEDFAFCDDYTRKYSKPIHVWPDFDFRHGGYSCNFHNFLNSVAEPVDLKVANQ